MSAIILQLQGESYPKMFLSILRWIFLHIKLLTSLTESQSSSQLVVGIVVISEFHHRVRVANVSIKRRD